MVLAAIGAGNEMFSIQRTGWPQCMASQPRQISSGSRMPL
jgi:hypothetical protein